jgi:hypothetical protein
MKGNHHHGRIGSGLLAGAKMEVKKHFLQFKIVRRWMTFYAGG